MVPIGISEFTYGFAFRFEQVNANWIGVDAAPILPSLQTEQMSGWDVSIPLFGVPFFYQFKIPEYLSAAHATYIADGTYAGPYYRIDLHRRDNNNQHPRRFQELAAINPNTFYAAPELNTQAEFAAQFLAQTLADASRLIPLTDCDDIDRVTIASIASRLLLEPWSGLFIPNFTERLSRTKGGESLQRSSCEIAALVVTVGRALRRRPAVHNCCHSAEGYWRSASAARGAFPSPKPKTSGGEGDGVCTRGSATEQQNSAPACCSREVGNNHRGL